MASPVAMADTNKEKTLTGAREYSEGMSACEFNIRHFTPIITVQINESDKVGSEDIDTEDRVGNEDKVGSENIDTEDRVGNEDRVGSEDIDTEDIIK
jgi:hypothetical protein